MSSPLAVLRRNQKILLAIFGVIIMVVFVVGSSFDDLFKGSSSDDGGGTVVRWKYGNISRLDLEVMRHRNRVMSHFLDEVMKRARERKGIPKVAALRPAESERELIRRMVLTRKAKDSGVVISDAAVMHYLNQLSDAKLSERDYAELIAAIPNRRIGEQQIFEEIRQQLAADNQFRMMALWGWNSVSPGMAWDLFNRVHHRVQAEVVPIEVDDYRKEIADPSEAELKKFFEEHKLNYPFPESPTPGFRRRPQAAFEYIKLEFDKFVELEKAKLTDDELRAEYDTRVKRGEFKVPELPAAPEKPAEKTDEPAEKDAEKPEEKPSEKPADKPTEKPAEEKPTEEKPGACQDKPADAKPGEDKPADKPAADKPATKPEEKPADKPADKPAEKTAEKPAEKTEATPTDKPAEKPEDAPAEKPEEKPAEPAKPKFRPFEEVKDEIALSLARPKAQQEFEKAKNAVRKELDTASRDLRFELSRKEQGTLEGALPAAPNTKEIAAQFNLTYGNTPLVDALSVEEYEIGQGMLMSFVGGFQQIRFAQMAFSDEIRLYDLREIPGGDPNVTFLYWKVEKKPASVPKLEEVREDVIAVWKRRKALDKAKADAEAKAKEARGKESLKDVFGDKVAETNMFSWVTSGAVGFGMGMPSLSRVENVDLAGANFMEAVFSLKVGEVGVAVNQPENKVYIVRVVREGINEEVRRTMFIQSGMTRDVAMLAESEKFQGLEYWLDELDREMQVQWVGVADSGDGSEG